MQYRKLGSSDLIVSEIALGHGSRIPAASTGIAQSPASDEPSTLASRCLTRPTSTEGARRRHSWAKHSREWIAPATCWRRSCTSR